QPDELVEDLSLLHGIGDAGDDEAHGCERNDADSDKDAEGQKIAEVVDVKDEASQKQFADDGGNGQNVVGHDAGGQHVRGGHGGNVKTPENALFAESHEGGAQSPEAAHNRHGNDRPKQKFDDMRIALSDDAGKEEEKAERHDHTEKQKHFIAQREANAHAGKR